MLGLGSPTFRLPQESYASWTSTYEWKEIYGHELLYGGALFTHQYSQLWLDFRGIQDVFMRGEGSAPWYAFTKIRKQLISKQKGKK